MTEHDCEQVLLSALALSDGEAPVLAQAFVEQHLLTCEGCRREFAAHQATGMLLKPASRQSFEAHLWRTIAPRLRPRGTGVGMVGILGIAAAVACTLRGGILAWSPILGWLGSVVTIALVSAVFLILRENPFALPEGFPSNPIRSPDR